MAYSDNRSRTLGCLLTVLTIAAMIAVLGPWLFPGPYTTAFPRSFNSERWKSADTWTDTRCSMIADLEQRVGVVGKTRAELHELLGKSDDEDGDPSTSHWHVCPSFMDIYILEVRWHGDFAISARVRDT